LAFGSDEGGDRVNDEGGDKMSERWFGAGRVNLIGDHTDYNQGLALPMAIGLGVSVTVEPTVDDGFEITSDAYPGVRATVPLDVDADAIATLEPAWARLAAAMVLLARPTSGGRVHVASTVPRGSGLSSSAALAVALADAFGVDGDALVIARLCQAAEHRIGVPVGLMDPLACAGGVSGHALLIDFASLDTRHVPVPAGAEFIVVDSGQHRDLRTSAYGTRVAECEAATALIGPLGLATEADVIGLRDSLLRRRARHVISECSRVHAFASVLAEGDLAGAGLLMNESHHSLAAGFEATTPELDALVGDLRSRPGVLGVRMTGAGFGGCVIVLGEPGALDPTALRAEAWRVEPCDGTVARRTGR
jgi:galactokinase